MALDLFAELVALANALDAGRIEYALCGGLAVAVHGAPRFTKDIDLLVLPADAVRAKAVAKALGFTAESLPMRFKATGELHRVVKFGETGEVLMLDLLLVGEELAPVWVARERVAVAGGSLSVVSRAGLVAMKLASGRPQDLLDVQKLSETE
ncbi:MAG: nucleotidyl transferase AbiEii/AbiGii toxin family protein [Myxococcales bacterium]|nr:nucleotidyl transferase AbiEii/AbiGii toxin family protein [Myxococcales bacterium]